MILFINYYLISSLEKSLLDLSSKPAPINKGKTLINDRTIGAVSNVYAPSSWFDKNFIKTWMNAKNTSPTNSPSVPTKI